MTRFAVIMAGGSGTRFWPRSRRRRPKQLLEIEPGRTLIQATLDRLPDWIARDRIIVVTNEDQADELQAQTGLLESSIVREPIGRDTAACVALAAALIQKRVAESSFCVLSADHLITPHEAFASDLDRAFLAAEETGALVTFGVRPHAPETGYGYIRCGSTRPDGLFEVSGFEEKPDRAAAERYVAGGRHLWNCGLFVWRTDAIRAALARHLPELAAGIDAIVPALDGPQQRSALAAVYPSLPKQSIDRGVLQHSDRLLCVPASFTWDDVGSFAALERHLDADANDNVVVGEAALVGARGCVVDNRGDGVVALLDVENLVVVRVGDAVLVTRKGSEQRVKDVVEELRKQAKDRYL